MYVESDGMGRCKCAAHAWEDGGKRSQAAGGRGWAAARGQRAAVGEKEKRGRTVAMTDEACKRAIITVCIKTNEQERERAR